MEEFTGATRPGLADIRLERVTGKDDLATPTRSVSERLRSDSPAHTSGWYESEEIPNEAVLDASTQDSMMSVSLASASALT